MSTQETAGLLLIAYGDCKDNKKVCMSSSQLERWLLSIGSDAGNKMRGIQMKY